jgi:hypothetical protein
VDNLEKVPDYKIPIYVALLTIAGSAALSFYSNNATRDLEREKYESALISSAIVWDDQAKTKQRIRFLMKADLISDDKQKVVESLSDSMSISHQANAFTASDSSLFYDLHTSTNDGSFIKNTLVTFIGTEEMADFRIQAYTDYQGMLNVTLPRAVAGKTILITLEKYGYKTRKFEHTFPKKGYGSGDLNKFVLEKI